MTHSPVDTLAIGSAPGEVFGPAGAGHPRFAFSCATAQVVASPSPQGAPTSTCHAS